MEKELLSNWLSCYLTDNLIVIANKLIPFELLFKWYCDYNHSYTSSYSQFARSLTLLSKGKKEYYKETRRDETKRRRYFFYFYPGHKTIYP